MTHPTALVVFGHLTKIFLHWNTNVRSKLEALEVL